MSNSYAINFGANLTDEWLVHEFTNRVDRDAYVAANPNAEAIGAGRAKSMAQATAMMVCHGPCVPPISWNGGVTYWYETRNRGEFDEADDEVVWFRFLF